MALSDTALVTLAQAKAHLKIDAAASLRVDAEYVGEGDGSDTTFSLDYTPIGGSLQLYVDGTLQVETDDYSISGADITFVTAPGNGEAITASYDRTASSNTFESYDDDVLEKLIEAATKIAEDYSDRAFIQRTITEYHSGDGEKVLRLFKRPVVSITSVVRDISEASTDGDGSTVAWTLDEEPTSGSVKVYVDGVLQTVTIDYTISGSEVTFVSAPDDGAKIAFAYTHTIVRVNEYTEQLAKGRIFGASVWAKNVIYPIVYVAGEASTRAATQVLVPDAVTAVLLILSDLFENRGDTIDSVNIAGIGSTSYKLPSRAERILFNMKPLGGFV